ncbi:hypothetical protein CALVIDRAFT_560386 [Calocera viscosa TUFC12733]|uniref:Uncharacterized protein n=1 Tax=Calocera viscosa (strain TUFC12733) TaxID=1330018 RepID=A0A167QZI9_CALVF|nr:hypothetical protein CALVIDRAFT_560386 [Calocera viscosa TUFC12733]
MKPLSSAPLTRALMTFHHIRSPRKKRFITEYTTLYSLRGVCKVGHPGVLVLVGDKEGCEAVVRAVKKLTWASCHLRKISSDVDPLTINQKGVGDVWLLNGKAVGCEMVEKMADIGGMVKQAGWEDWWREGMSQGA